MKTIQEKLYDFPAGNFCGVLMPKSVMVKIAKLQAKYAQEMKEVLTENKSLLYTSDWTLANTKDDDGKITKQITIKYVDESSTMLDHRINLFGPVKPKTVPVVYVARNHTHAQEIAEQVMKDETHDVDAPSQI